MTNKRKILVAVLIVLLIAALLIYINRNTVIPPTDIETEPQAISTEEDTDFSDTERRAMIDNIRTINEDTEILDYSFGRTDSIVRAVAVCRDLKSGLETGLAFITELGTGYLVLATDAQFLKYLKADGVKLDSSDTVRLSFSDTAKDEILDYRITFSEKDKAINFVVDSSIRKANK